MGIFNNTKAFIDRAKANQSPMPNAGMLPNAISPTAFSNQDMIQNVFGQANPGTFTRSVGMPTDSIDQSIQTDANEIATDYNQIASQAEMSSPKPPPYGVQTPITPNYDLNAQ